MDEFVITSAPPVQKTQITLPQAIQFASINISSSGDNTIIAADPARRIKILSYVFVAGGSVNIIFKSGASNSLSGAMPFVINAGIAAPPVAPSTGPYMQTNVNEAFVINLSGAVGVTGHLSYYLE